MSDATHEVWITGIGLLSSLGEGADAHWHRLTDPAGPTPVVDETSFAPWPIHPLAPVDYDQQIPKKGDQRQMEPWQRIGTYAAGLALADAGVARQTELLMRTHMIVAAGGGERDVAVDLAITHQLAGMAEPTGPTLNARLSADLRPTLFLAQLSNLLAGSISIVHGVRGSSRTFMGEEACGADAARIGLARLAAGQAELALVGGAQNAARADMLMLYGAGGQALAGPMRPVWQRAAQPGFALGSVGAFLVLEARAHAEARGAHGLARLVGIQSDMSDRRPGAAHARATESWQQLAPHRRPGTLGVLSGATGVAQATSEEQAFLAELPGPTAIRATGTVLGHGVEAAFPMNLALAALALSRGGFYPPFSADELVADAPVRQILVTGFGQRRGEALALLEAI
jgi:3-oxoacyl-[acyl-carrier-protein] synthase II